MLFRSMRSKSRVTVVSKASIRTFGMLCIWRSARQLSLPPLQDSSSSDLWKESFSFVTFHSSRSRINLTTPALLPRANIDLDDLRTRHNSFSFGNASLDGNRRLGQSRRWWPGVTHKIKKKHSLPGPISRKLPWSSQSKPIRTIAAYSYSILIVIMGLGDAEYRPIGLFGFLSIVSFLMDALGCVFFQRSNCSLAASSLEAENASDFISYFPLDLLHSAKLQAFAYQPVLKRKTAEG